VRGWRSLIVASFAVAGLASGAVTSDDAVCYQLSATMTDGAVLSGTFTVDLEAAAENAYSSLVVYPIEEFDVELDGSTLFLGTEGGNLTELSLIQRSDPAIQELSLLVLADDAGSNAFGVIRFAPFTGAIGELVPIEGEFTSGYLDGAGYVEFGSVSLTVVPEPRVWVALSGVAMVAAWRRRRDRRA